MPEWCFPLSPVAASRPRVSRHGAYYAGPYKTFRQECVDIIDFVLGPSFEPYDSPLRVDVELFIKQPKSTKLSMPKADIDNYLKAIFDSLNKKLWTDDTLIQSVYSTKQWAEKGSDGYFTVGVDRLPRLP
jgi:Holliday junction resolvase RusA-like endonuclease